MYSSFLTCMKTVKAIASVAHGGERAREEAFLGDTFSLCGRFLNGFMTHKNNRLETADVNAAARFLVYTSGERATQRKKKKKKKKTKSWFDTCQHAGCRYYRCVLTSGPTPVPQSSDNTKAVQDVNNGNAT